MRLLMKIIIILSLSVFVLRCAGASSFVRFEDVQYPVSLSAFLYDAEGQPVYPGQRLEKVGTIEYEKTIWASGYGHVEFSYYTDPGGIINEQVQGAQGDGVINLVIATEPCALNAFLVFSFIPFWPGCASVSISGDIVKLSN